MSASERLRGQVVLPMLTYDVHALATWCAIALVALGYVEAGCQDAPNTDREEA